jgi:hypothetical protein
MAGREESTTMKNLTNDMLLDLARLSLVRLDGAWFMAVAKKYGIEAAWEMDVEASKTVFLCCGKESQEKYHY